MEAKIEYVNHSGHQIGVTKIEPRTGEEKGVPVLPGDSVWLTEDERIATARASRKPEHNPFANGWLARVSDPVTHAPTDRPYDAPHVSEAAPPPEPRREESPDFREETGAPPMPPGDTEPEQGQRQPGEEVGTPGAVEQSGRRVQTAEAIRTPAKAPATVPGVTRPPEEPVTAS